MHWLTGGNKRTWEVMKRARAYGIDYVSVIDKSSLLWYRERNILIPRFDYILSFAGWASKSRIRYLFTYVRAATQLAKIAMKERVDLIYSPSEFPNLERIAKIASFISGIPWTVLLQMIPVVGMPKDLGFSNLIKLRAYTSLAGHAILLTPGMMVSKYMNSIDEALKIERIEPGIGIDFDKIGSIASYQERFDAIYYARLTQEKGANEVLKVWKKVVNSKADAKLAVCGIASKEAEIVFKKEIIRERLEQNVIYFGFQEEERLYSIIKSSSLVVYPSHWDNFPLVVLEALACGRPVIAYSIDAIKLSYSNCEAVIQVKEGDTDEMARNVLNIFQNPSLLPKLSMAALAFAQRFDWSKVVEAEKNAYFKVLGQNDKVP